MDSKNNKRPVDNIDEFFRRSEEGENVPNDVCKRATVDVLNHISRAIKDEHLNNPPKSKFLRNLKDESTSQEKLIKNCIETNMNSLDCFYRCYKLNNIEDDYVKQIDKLFDLYQKHFYKDFGVACSETAKKIEESI